MKYNTIDTFSISSILNKYFEDTCNEQLFAVIIGANNGELVDFITPHLHRPNLRSLLVEPLSEPFKQLKKKFNSSKNLLFENVAIGTKNGRRNMYRIAGNHSNGWQGGLGTLSKTVISDHDNQINDLKKNIIKEKVNCLTLNALLIKHNMHKMNILQIDTEGFDYEIIKSIAFDRYKPDIIIYEYLHLTLYQNFACIEFLQDKGYLLWKNTDSFDVVALNSALVS